MSENMGAIKTVSAGEADSFREVFREAELGSGSKAYAAVYATLYEIGWGVPKAARAAVVLSPLVIGYVGNAMQVLSQTNAVEAVLVSACIVEPLVLLYDQISAPAKSAAAIPTRP